MDYAAPKHKASWTSMSYLKNVRQNTASVLCMITPKAIMHIKSAVRPWKSFLEQPAVAH